MVRYQDTLWCDGCGVEIRWEPVTKGDLIYCCQTCMLGEVCDCDESEDEYPPPEKKPKFTQYIII